MSTNSLYFERLGLHSGYVDPGASRCEKKTSTTNNISGMKSSNSRKRNNNKTIATTITTTTRTTTTTTTTQRYDNIQTFHVFIWWCKIIDKELPKDLLFNPLCDTCEKHEHIFFRPSSDYFSGPMIGAVVLLSKLVIW